MGAPSSPMFLLLSPSLSLFLSTQVSWVASLCWFILLWVWLHKSSYLFSLSFKGPPTPTRSHRSMLATGICIWGLMHCGQSLSAVLRRRSLQLCSDDTDTLADTLGSILVRLDSLWPRPNSHLPWGAHCTCSWRLLCSSPGLQGLSPMCPNDLLSLPEILAMRINQSASLNTGIWCHLCTGGGVCADLREFWQDKAIRQTISTSSLPAWTIETSPTWVVLSVFCWVGTTY